MEQVQTPIGAPHHHRRRLCESPSQASGVVSFSHIIQTYDSEYQRLYSMTKNMMAKASRDDRIWEAPGKAPGYESCVKQTIFQLKPTLLVVDEIHNRRKHPVKVYPLRDAATFVMGLLGTPLVTEPQVQGCTPYPRCLVLTT